MATLEQIQAKLKKLQVQADVMLARKAQTAVDQIRALMLEHGLTTADIEARAKSKREGKSMLTGGAGRKQVSSATGVKGAPKYQHPKTGATWSGHGRAPAWIAEAKDRSKFLVEPNAGAGANKSVKGVKVGAGKSKAAGRSAVKKGQPKGPQPALYRDPKSGATWSGRGRAPAWIGANRSKFLIDGSTAAAKDAGPVKVAKPKLAGLSKAEAKKVIVRKVAAKKVAKKTPTTEQSSSKRAAAPISAKTAVKKATGRKASPKNVAPAVEAAPTPKLAISKSIV